MANKNFTDYKLIVAANLRKLKVDKTYKRRQKEMKKIICKRANERQNRGRNQGKYSEDEKDC